MCYIRSLAFPPLAWTSKLLYWLIQQIFRSTLLYTIIINIPTGANFLYKNTTVKLCIQRTFYSVLKQSCRVARNCMFLRNCKGEIMFSINLSSDLHTAAEMSVQMDIINNLGRSSIITLAKYFLSFSLPGTKTVLFHLTW